MAASMSLYINSGRTPADAADEDMQRCRALLRSARESLLTALAADPNAMLEAKGWLATTLAAAADPAAAARAACLLPRPSRQPNPAATGTGLNAAAQRQLLQLLMERQPADVWRHLRTQQPQLLPDFFAASDARIRGWFAHFDMAGISAFQYGAKALANYALAERDHAWQHLVWTGKHAQAPVAVAAKPHYFCELDVVRSVRRLLRDCPGFWRSEELARSCEGGAHLALDYAFFVEELMHMLEQGRSADRDPLLAMLHDLVQQSGWRPMCERLLPFMGEAELLRMVNSLGQQAQQQRHPQPQKEHRQRRQHTERGDSLSSSGLAAWAVCGSSSTARDLAPLLLSGVEWDSAKDAVLANALGCHRANLWKLLQEQGREAGDQAEEGAEQLTKLMLTVEQLHGPDGCSEAAHTGLLATLGDLSSPRRRLLLLLEFWTLRLHLLQAAASTPHDLEQLLQQLGAQYQWLQPGSPGVAIAAGGGDAARGGKAGPSGRAASTSSDAEPEPQTSSESERQHRSSSAKRRHKRKLSEKHSSSKRKRKGSHRKHKKRRRHGTPDSGVDGSSGSSLLDASDFPPHTASRTSRYASIPSDDDAPDMTTLDSAVARHAGHTSPAHMAVGDAAFGAAAGIRQQTAPDINWSVRMPGWEDGIVGSTVDVVDAVACYSCRRWVQRLLAEST